MQNMHFWTYIIEKEFDEFKAELEELFQVKKFVHDSENYWEYMEGFSRKFNAKLNISRPHKAQMDLPNHEIPLHIIFYECSDSYVEQIGNNLNDYFKIPVYFGNFRDNSTNEKRDLVFTPKKTFKRIDLTGLIKTKNAK
jgi:hypothetical protein